jgi:hypothetical protein
MEQGEVETFKKHRKTAMRGTEGVVMNIGEIDSVYENDPVEEKGLWPAV